MNMLSPNASDIHGTLVHASQIVVLTKVGGPLTKQISIKDDGTILSDGSACQMSSGTARRALISGVDDLANLIDNLSDDQAIALGRLRSDLPEQVSVVTKNRLDGSAGAIARTNTFISYEQGAPAFALLDYDTKGMPAAVANKLADVGGFVPALDLVIPELQNVANVLRLSTSAGLFRTDTGQKFKGSQGRHLFVLVKDGSDIDRFLRDLHGRCWLHGFGWRMVGRGGQFLDRSIVDRMVGAPERLVFEGAPILVPPLAQDPDSRRPIATEGEALDTLKACPPLTIVEKAQIAKLMAQTKQQLAPAAAKEHDTFVKEQVKKTVARTKCSEAIARATVISLTNGVLLPTVVLPFDDEEFAGCSVADVLADPEKFEGATLADPIEGEEYGRCKAKVMRRADGAPWIHSFAHGRSIYELKYDAASIEALILETAADEIVDLFATLVVRAHLSEVELETLKKRVALRSGNGKRTIDKTVRSAVDEDKVKAKSEARERRTAEDKDPRPRLRVPAPNAEWIPQVECVQHVFQKFPGWPPHVRNGEGESSRGKAGMVPGTHEFMSSN
jgi:hypothetical protein